MNSNHIKKQLNHAYKLLEQYKESLDSDPNNTAYQLRYKSFEEHIYDLRKQLAELIVLENSSLFEFRLVGDGVIHDGRIPLDILVKFADNLRRALGYLAYKISNPDAKTQKCDQALHLELSDILYGSCRLYIAGCSDKSSLHFTQTATAFFDILNHDITKPIDEKIVNYGEKSIFYISKILNEMKKHKIVAEFKLLSLNKVCEYWNGDIVTINNLLQQIINNISK